MEADRELLHSYLTERLKEGKIESKQRTYKGNQKLNKRTGFFKLKEHVDDFLNGYIENRFIIMPGLRGVGKTTLIFQLYNYLLKEKKIKSNRKNIF